MNSCFSDIYSFFLVFIFSGSLFFSLFGGFLGGFYLSGFFELLPCLRSLDLLVKTLNFSFMFSNSMFFFCFVFSAELYV